MNHDLGPFLNKEDQMLLMECQVCFKRVKDGNSLHLATNRSGSTGTVLISLKAEIKCRELKSLDQSSTGNKR